MTPSTTLRVTLESGPKGKRVVAVAPDWPGLERGGKTPEQALEVLEAYLPRYAKVARLARMGRQFTDSTRLEVVERYRGAGSTDFWGISFAFSSIDTTPLSNDDLKRQLSLLRACWRYFDGVRGRVSSEMQKGPRGGGRDRDVIVRHVVANEQDWAKKIGIHTPDDAVIVDDRGLREWRDAYCRAVRACSNQGKMARTWPLRYLVRHTAFHVMDHAWEMEDKDLSAQEQRCR